MLTKRVLLPFVLPPPESDGSDAIAYALAHLDHSPFVIGVDPATGHRDFSGMVVMDSGRVVGKSNYTELLLKEMAPYNPNPSTMIYPTHLVDRTTAFDIIERRKTVNEAKAKAKHKLTCLKNKAKRKKK